MTVINPNEMGSSWAVIVNRNAGNKKAEKDWDIIHGHLLCTGLDLKVFFTGYREHAIEITDVCIQHGFRKFVVIGGDGTLNEVINGIFRQSIVPFNEFLVGMIPVGTGNDWCRMFGIPDNYEEAIEMLKKQMTFIQDIGRVEYFNGDLKEQRYFINMAGMGYDAEVADKTNKDKARGKGGNLVYLKNLFTSLLFYKHTITKIIIDDQSEKPLENQTFSMSVGICRYNGGGMMQLPAAIPNDGLFDVTLIRKISKFTVIKQVKNLFDGSFVKHPKVLTFRGKTLLVESSPPIRLEVDGESLGRSPFYFDIIPNALKVIIGSAGFSDCDLEGLN